MQDNESGLLGSIFTAGAKKKAAAKQQQTESLKGILALTVEKQKSKEAQDKLATKKLILYSVIGLVVLTLIVVVVIVMKKK
jgi:hypothetical protein